jgi:hypothetical protein
MIYPNYADTPSLSLAIVISADNGRAFLLKSEHEKIKVHAQGSHLPPLKTGDEVLFFDMRKGAYIIARSLAANEHPLIPLNLNINDADINLITSGKIKIIGEEIRLSAQHHIHLNTPEESF